MKNKLKSPYDLFDDLLSKMTWYEKTYMKLCFLINDIYVYLCLKFYKRRTNK